jgi:hypothetical protein
MLVAAVGVAILLRSCGNSNDRARLFYARLLATCYNGSAAATDVVVDVQGWFPTVP